VVQFLLVSATAASAPGRVNLIGEHTDYNGGYVLPIALPQETTVHISARRDRTVRSASVQLGPAATGDYQLGTEQRRNNWLDYAQGVTWALTQNGFRLSGFDLQVSSDVPIGKGLSSSAALEIALLRALRTLNGLALTDTEIAMVAHRAETEFVGAPVGIMDQMVCSLGDRRTALFLDASTRTFEKIAMPAGAMIAVVDSGLAHQHATGDYRIRRRQCDEAAASLGVRQLRDLTPADFGRISVLEKPLNRRARHFVTENARVLAAVDAMRRGDVPALGALFLESHASMRDDFEVSLPEIDRLVELARRDPDVFGARLTGGGFGGAVVMLCTPSGADDAAHRIAEQYRRETKQDGRVLVPQAPLSG